MKESVHAKGARGPDQAKAKTGPWRSPRNAKQPCEVDSILNAGVQRKLRMGRDNDTFEREADRIADRVISTNDQDQEQPLEAAAAPGLQHKQSAAQSGTTSDTVSGTTSDTVSDTTSGAPSDIMAPNLENRLRALAQGGQSLPQRGFFESRMGHDFSNTRIHTGSQVHDLVSGLNARAFTYGNNIAFGRGEFSPDTNRGRHLIAHELTHVVQQGAATKMATPPSGLAISAGRNAPQLQADTVATNLGGNAASGSEPVEEVIADIAGNKRTGKVDRTDAANATITWSQLSVPRFKNRDHRAARYQALAPLQRGKGRSVDRSGDNNPAQRDQWLREVDGSAIQTALENKLKSANAGVLPEGNQHVFEVRNSGGQNRYYSGSLADLSAEFRIPTWGGKGRTGSPRFFHVDHIVELQLANWPHSQQGNDMQNMELLEGRRNQDSGRIIQQNIMDKISGFIRATDSAYGATAAEIKQNFTLVFEGVTGSGGPGVSRSDYWTRSELEAAEHLNSVAAADPTKIGGPGLVRIFSRPSGGVSRRFVWSGTTTEEQEVPSSLAGERYWLKPLVITHKYFKTDPESETEGTDFGYFRVHVSQRDPVFETTEPVEYPLTRFVGARYGGSLPDTVRTSISNLKADFFSPIVFDQVEINGDGGIVASGNIEVSLPFFEQGTNIGIRLENGDVRVSKEFSIEDIASPDPFEISECSLALSYGLRDGWALSGNVQFGLDNVGSGQITAAVDAEQGFSAQGQFDFDSELFNPATLSVQYQNGNWEFAGNVGIEQGLIPGVSSAALEVSWAEQLLSGSGQVQFEYPWLDSGTLELRHNQLEGFSLVADVGLTGAVPGLNSARVGMRISRNAEDVWSLGGSIDADLDVSRVKGFGAVTLVGNIQDGIFDARVTTEFAWDRATGNATVGVTNQALDADGNPVEGEFTPQLVFYGSGDITLQLTPWLDAEAGIVFDREGHVSVRGAVEVTRDIEILSDEQTPDMEVPRSRRPGFDVQIPLLNVGVADVALGLEGELNAYLRTSPLLLRNVRLDVFYEFDQPANTRVEGTASLFMDVRAGLEGILELGLSARILVLRGGGKINLTMGAELGNPLTLSVRPSWNAAEGFAVEADLNAVLQPTLYASLAGYLYAEIDLLLGSIDVWESERLDLANERVPLDIRLGATATATYQEKPNSELRYSGLTWVVPSADEMKNALMQLVRNKV